MGKFLARALKDATLSTNIAAIKTKDSLLTQETTKIAQRFQEYYTTLYNLPNSHKPKDLSGTKRDIISQFLEDSGLPSLSDLDTQTLEELITTIELSEASKTLKTGKSPGPDGLTAHYYNTFLTPLAPHMVKIFNFLKDPCETPQDFLRAHVTVLPKPNKDPLECTSYRPISLLNTDLKIYTKILANRLRPLLHKLIEPEQVGFMPGREAKDNVIKALNLIHKSQTDTFEGMLLY